MRVEEINEMDDVSSWFVEYKSTDNPKIKKQLRDLIVIAYLPLVRKISHGLARRSTDPVEDLIQVGSVGLIKAIDQYDSTQGSNFKTYATYLITGEIRHYLRDKATMIRAPRELQELSFRINLLTQSLTQTLGKEPSDAEIAEALAISVGKVCEIAEVDRRKQTISLDQVISNSSDSEQSIVDNLIDDKYQEFLNNRENRIMLTEAIELLDDTLKEVIKLSYFDDMSQRQIGEKVGISQMQVSRRIKKALAELFDIITKSKDKSVLEENF